jgi:hypothetical protein
VDLTVSDGRINGSIVANVVAVNGAIAAVGSDLTLVSVVDSGFEGNGCIAPVVTAMTSSVTLDSCFCATVTLMSAGGIFSGCEIGAVIVLSGGVSTVGGDIGIVTMDPGGGISLGTNTHLVAIGLSLGCDFASTALNAADQTQIGAFTGRVGLFSVFDNVEGAAGESIKWHATLGETQIGGAIGTSSKTILPFSNDHSLTYVPSVFPDP